MKRELGIEQGAVSPAAFARKTKAAAAAVPAVVLTRIGAKTADAP